MAGSRAGLKKVTKMVRGKKGTVRRTYWMKSDGGAAAAPKKGFLRRHAGKIAGAAALAAGAYLAHKHRGAIGGAAKGALSGYRHIKKLGETVGSGSTRGERAAGALLGAAGGGWRGHSKDTARLAAGAQSRRQLGNRAAFVAGGLKDAAVGAVRDRAGRAASAVGSVGAGARTAATVGGRMAFGGLKNAASRIRARASRKGA